MRWSVFKPLNYFVLTFSLLQLKAAPLVSSEEFGEYYELEKNLSYSDEPEELEKLNEFLQRYPTSPYKSQILLYCLANEFESQKGITFSITDWSEGSAALDSANTFASLYPSHSANEYIAYLNCQMLYNVLFTSHFLNKIAPNYRPYMIRADLMKLARNECERFLNEYSHSPYADQVEMLLKKVLSLLGKNHLYIAKFLFSQNTYIACLSHCTSILQLIPESPEAVKAMLLMRKAYLSLELIPEAEAITALLRKGYVGSQDLLSRQLELHSTQL